MLLRFSYLFIVLLLLTFKLCAKVPVELYGELPQISMMVVSPSGDKIAYRKSQGSSEVMIVFDLKARKLLASLNVSDLKPRSAYFISEEHLILVAENNIQSIGLANRHEFSAAFALNIETKKFSQLLRAGRGIYDAQTRLGTVVGVSNDKQFVYMPAWEDSTTYSLMSRKLDSKRKPRLKKIGADDVVDFFVHDDEVLAIERYDNKYNQHVIEVLEDGDWREIYREKTKVRTKAFVGITADAQSLVFLAYNREGVSAYYTMSLKDGKIHQTKFSSPDKDIEGVISDVNRVVHGVSYSGFKPSYGFFDDKIQQAVSKVIEMMPDHAVELVDYSPDWQNMIFLVQGHGIAGDYYLYKNGKLIFLASKRPDFKPEQIFQVVETQIKARDGLTIPTLLTIPAEEKLSNLPAILLPHGGPASYDKIEFDYMAQYFASRGYMVIQPQFRGSDGFGWDFRAKGHGEWGKKMQDDLTDAVRTLVKSGYINENKVCIVGASYGGYAALAGAAFTPDIYQCAVSINGVTDIEKMLADGKHKYGRHHWVVSYWEKVTAKGKLDKDHLAKISPINHVEKVKIPVLLIHGEHDDVVPFEQSDDMYDELKDAKKQVKLVELEKGDHHLSKAVNRMKALKAIDAFVSKHLALN